MTRPAISPTAYRRIAIAALVFLGVIIVTGAAVRLTGSGLGCPDWPTCERGDLVSATNHHQAIEQANRLFTGAVSISVILAVLGSLVRAPRRRDLTAWSLGLVAGVLGQVVLGGLTVLLDLTPPIVMSHFLLSMVLLWNAVVLVHRAGWPDPPAGQPLEPGTVVVDRRTVLLTRALSTVAAGVLVTGTVVTGSGPHGGDETVDRLAVYLPTAARIHGITVMMLLALTLAVLWRVRRQGTTPAVAGVAWRGHVLLGVLLAQGAIGYTQYFTGVPVLLVGFHILGAVLLWVAVVRFHLGLRVPIVTTVPATHAAQHHLAPVAATGI